jgi:phosphate transport system substrate-binding protein
LADIFLGKITKWNDDAIKKVNPDVKLPGKDITVVHRADGSGTTKIFTHYLNEVSKEWSEKVGSGKAVNWPVGVGGKGNEGVASYVKQIRGSIGYVEYAYALKNNLAYAQLRNHDGNFVKPTIESFQAAAANADWENAPGFYMFLNNQPGANSWPITGVTFILMYKQQDDATKAKEMLKYFNWCFKYGDKTAEELHYVPIPDNVVKLVENLWKTDIKTVSPVWQ